VPHILLLKYSNWWSFCRIGQFNHGQILQSIFIRLLEKKITIIWLTQI